VGQEIFRKSLGSGDQAHTHIPGKSGRKSVDRDGEDRCPRWVGIASYALLPAETPMGSLCSGLHAIAVAGEILF
jgi:hypothetical protein